MIKLATLFSGIGAIEEALKQLDIDYKVVFACDNGEREISFDVNSIKQDIKGKDVCEINKLIEDIYYTLSNKPNKMQIQYEANFEVPKGHFYQDVRLLDATIYKKEKIDLLLGGSPCQSFSVIGKRGGFEDTRGTLFFEYARIIKEAQPKVFIYENVLGMLTHDKGKTWETIQNVFNELGYNIKVNIMNAKNYGIPQDRKRIFVVGTKKENTFEKPLEMELTTSIKDYLESDVDPKYYMGEKGFKFVTNPKYKNRAKVNASIMMCQKANQQFNWNGDFIFVPIESITNQNILNRAYVGEFKGQKGVVRKLTPRECLRLMGFSDNYKIVVDDNMAWRQAGNAIVVNVLKLIVKELMEKGLL
jgi:DNA (cytosine-5)-methyltransferase 1